MSRNFTSIGNSRHRWFNICCWNGIRRTVESENTLRAASDRFWTQQDNLRSEGCDRVQQTACSLHSTPSSDTSSRAAKKDKKKSSSKWTPQKKSKVSSSDNKCSRSITLPDVNCDNCSVESEMILSSQNRVMQQNMFQFCDVETLDDVFRASLCEQLNVTKSPSTQRGRRHSSVCSALRRLIELQSQTAVRVTVYDISGDNNFYSEHYLLV